jgi:hypothetical protein
MTSRTFCAYGLRVQSSFDVPVAPAEAEGEPDVTLRLVERSETAAHWSDTHGTLAWQTMFPNDCHVRCERGREGDHLLTFGRKASFHLDSRDRTLLCAPAAPESLDWQRFLLDTALCCVSSIRGFEALHASAVRTPRGVVAFVGSPGSGKSTLAAELVRRGHSLFCDDVLALSRVGGRILVHAGPPLMTLGADSRALEKVSDQLEAPTEDGMVWVRVRRAGGKSETPAAIFILDRRREADLQVVRESVGPGRLLPHALSLSRDPARALSRFGLLRELVASVPVYRLAARNSEVAGLADVVDETLQVAETSAEEQVHHAPAA